MTGHAQTTDRDRVHDAADIVDVASMYTALKVRGGKHIGLCPFHQEKTPSFYVDRAKKLYYCFGCHRGGDVFKLVEELEHFAFPEALRFLAERYHIELTGRSGGLATSERKRLIGVNEKAAALFEKWLRAPEGRPARELLKKRGVTPETAAALRLGYAPPQWDRLFTALRQDGVPGELIQKAGLVVEKQGGSGYYDRFRDRLIFPIMSESGEVVAFGGRILQSGDKTSPKFINSPETAVYSKGRMFYGWNLTREHIRKSGVAVIVEGYMDFVLLYQQGIRNCIACLGTSLTKPQVEVLARHGVVGAINFDPDAAGREAVKRSMQVFMQEDVDVRVVMLPDGMDPDEFVLANGADAYQKLLDSSPSGVAFALDNLFVSYSGHDNSQKIHDVAEFLRLCRSMSNPVRLELALRDATTRFGMSPDQLRSEMEKIPAEAGAAHGRAAVATPAAVRTAEKRLLLFSISNVDGFRDLAPAIGAIRGLALQTIFQKLTMLAARGGWGSEKDIMPVLDARETAALTAVLMESEPGAMPSREEAVACVEALRNDTGEAAVLQADVTKAQEDVVQGGSLNQAAAALVDAGTAGGDTTALGRALARKQEFALRKYGLVK